MIVFASDEPGVALINRALCEGVQIDAVVIHPDEPTIINEKMSTPLERLGIPCLEAKCSDSDFIQFLNQQESSAALLFWWPEILSDEFLNAVNFPIYNVHPSLLPKHRGSAPSFWSLRAGDPGGLTLHRVNRGVDAGPIVAQQVIPTSWEDTGRTLYDRQRALAVDFALSHWALLENHTVPAELQGDLDTPAHRVKELVSEKRIDLDCHTSARDLLNLIRASEFSEDNQAYFIEAGVRYDVSIQIRAKRDPKP